MVALRDEIGGTPEIEIGKGLAEMRHESLDVFPSPTRLVQGVLKEHIRRGELVDDSEIARLTPELGEPAADDGLVFIFSRHALSPLCFVVSTDDRVDRCDGLWSRGVRSATRFPASSKDGKGGSRLQPEKATVTTAQASSMRRLYAR